MKKIVFAAILALITSPVFASDDGLSGNLGLRAAGSIGGTDAFVHGRVRGTEPGRSVVSSRAHSNTHVRSVSRLRGCGECGPRVVTKTHGSSNANGAGVVDLAPGAVGVAEYGAYGESMGGSLVLDGFLEIGEYDD